MNNYGYYIREVDVSNPPDITGDTDFCDTYCPLESKYSSGPNGSMCEGCCCEDAWDNYLEDYAEQNEGNYEVVYFVGKNNTFLIDNEILSRAWG